MKVGTIFSSKITGIFQIFDSRFCIWAAIRQRPRKFQRPAWKLKYTWVFLTCDIQPFIRFWSQWHLWRQFHQFRHRLQSQRIPLCTNWVQYILDVPWHNLHRYHINLKVYKLHCSECNHVRSIHTLHTGSTFQEQHDPVVLDHPQSQMSQNIYFLYGRKEEFHHQGLGLRYQLRVF